MIRRDRSLPMALALLLVLCATGPVLGAEPSITATTSAEPSRDLTPAERRAMSLAASRILRHAYPARQAVAAKDAKKATAQVEQGLKLVRIIEKAQPRYTVTSEIRAGDLSYSSEEVVSPPLVPIYEELGDVELLGPLASARKAKKSAAEEVVEDVSVAFTSLSLDLAAARAGLNQAREALAKGDLKGADRALVAVQRAAIFEVDAADVPLATARENLFLARSRIARGDSQGAKEALDMASAALEDYAKLSGKARAKQVAGLRSEIDDLSAKLSKGSAEASNAEAVQKKILSWWDRVVHWWEE